MLQQAQHNLIVILGPTASGKTAMAVRLAAWLGSEIISADSRQVYIGMDIGTGKDLNEYNYHDKKIPYHLIDIVSPDDDFNLFEYKRLFLETYEAISKKGIIPVLAGGTGLYIDSVLDDYNLVYVPEDQTLRDKLDRFSIDQLAKMLVRERPKLHNTTDLLEKSRLIRAIEIARFSRKKSNDNHCKKNSLEIRPVIIGLKVEREKLRERIKRRLYKRLDSGLVEEVENLYKSGLSRQRLDYFGLEYRYVSKYLQGELNRNDMIQKLYSAICKFAKRQETWFRRMEKNGHKINWIDCDDYESLQQIAANGFK